MAEFRILPARRGGKKNVLITDVLCLVVNCVWYMANLHVN